MATGRAKFEFIEQELCSVRIIRSARPSAYDFSRLESAVISRLAVELIAKGLLTDCLCFAHRPNRKGQAAD
jgi:hypothetical protein